MLIENEMKENDRKNSKFCKLYEWTEYEKNIVISRSYKLLVEATKFANHV